MSTNFTHKLHNCFLCCILFYSFTLKDELKELFYTLTSPSHHWYPHTKQPLIPPTFIPTVLPCLMIRSRDQTGIPFVNLFHNLPLEIPSNSLHHFITFFTPVSSFYPLSLIFVPVFLFYIIFPPNAKKYYYYLLSCINIIYIFHKYSIYIYILSTYYVVYVWIYYLVSPLLHIPNFYLKFAWKKLLHSNRVACCTAYNCILRLLFCVDNIIFNVL